MKGKGRHTGRVSYSGNKKISGFVRPKQPKLNSRRTFGNIFTRKRSKPLDGQTEAARAMQREFDSEKAKFQATCRSKLEHFVPGLTIDEQRGLYTLAFNEILPQPEKRKPEPPPATVDKLDDQIDQLLDVNIKIIDALSKIHDRLEALER